MDALRKIGKEAMTKVTGTELEKKIAEACSNKPWGASSTLQSEIAQATYNYSEYPVVMSNLWKRVHESSKNWRVVYKALTLLEYLVRNGSERSVEDARDHMYQVRSLCDFTHTEPGGVDQGINVREKARQVIDLLNDRERLLEEREKARQNRGKFGGVSSQKMQGFGSSTNIGGKYGGFSSEDMRRQQSGYGNGGIGNNGHGTSEHGSGGYASGGYGLGDIGSDRNRSLYDRRPTPRDASACASAPRAVLPPDSGKITLSLPGSKTRVARASGTERVQLQLSNDKFATNSSGVVKSDSQDLFGIDDPFPVPAPPPGAPENDLFSAPAVMTARNFYAGDGTFDAGFNSHPKSVPTDTFAGFEAAPHVQVRDVACDPFTSPAVAAVPSVLVDPFGSFAAASPVAPPAFDVDPFDVVSPTSPHSSGNFGATTTTKDPFSASVETLSSGSDFSSAFTLGTPAPALAEPAPALVEPDLPNIKSAVELMMETSMSNITLTDKPISAISTKPDAPPMGTGSGIGLASAKASAAATGIAGMMGGSNMAIAGINGGIGVQSPIVGFVGGMGMQEPGMRSGMMPGMIQGMEMHPNVQSCMQHGTHSGIGMNPQQVIVQKQLLMRQQMMMQQQMQQGQGGHWR